MKKNVIKLIIILINLFILTGCWDRMEIEQYAFVVAIGIDQGKEEGKMDVTFQIANPQVGSTNVVTAEKEPPTEVITLSASDFISAKSNANITISRKLNFTNVKTFIISEEFAKTDKLLLILGVMTRDIQIQRKINVIITKEKAQEFINNIKPALETRPHKFYDFMSQRWEENGFTLDASVGRFTQKIEGDNSAFLAIYATNKPEGENQKPKESEQTPGGESQPTSGETVKSDDDYLAGDVTKNSKNTVQIIGAAVIVEGKMMGTLTGDEVRHVLLLRKYSIARNWIDVYPDPLYENKPLTLRIIKKGIKIKVKANEVPEIDATIKLEVQLASIHSFANYVTDLKKQEELKKLLKKQFEDISKKLVEKSQKEFGVDLFEWSLHSRINFRTIKQYEDYNWMEKYKDAKVKIHYDIEITRFGKQLDPIDVKEIKKD